MTKNCKSKLIMELEQKRTYHNLNQYSFCFKCSFHHFEKRNNEIGYCGYFHCYTHDYSNCVTQMVEMIDNDKVKEFIKKY